MMGNQKGISTIIFSVIVTLLSCSSSVSSSFRPRVTATDDAIIIDCKNYRPFAVNPATTFDPYAVMDQQEQQPESYNEWFYLHKKKPSRFTLANVPSRLQNIKRCGRGPTTLDTHSFDKIAGGTEAKPNSWPFVASLYEPFFTQKQLCGGTLISDSKVLIAAQCLERLPKLFEWLMIVFIGVHSTNPLDAQMTRRISKIVFHKQYNAATYANDIAIITLDSPVTFSNSVRPVCLPAQSSDPDQFADQEAAILGWGDNNVLKQGRVRISYNSECKDKESLSKFVTDTTLCTSSRKRFTCEEDIGGPVVVQTSPGIWTLVGINSYTKDCKTSGLKTRVTAFRQWIDQNMRN